MPWKTHSSSRNAVVYLFIPVAEWCRWARAERCVERGELQTACSLRRGFSLDESAGSGWDSCGTKREQALCHADSLPPASGGCTAAVHVFLRWGAA